MTVLLCVAPFVARQAVVLTSRVIVSMLALTGSSEARDGKHDLGAFGTGLADVWNTSVVAGWGATNASTVTYLTPVVGVALGVAALQEELTWNQPVGVLLVLLGIVITRGRSGPLHRATR